MQDWPAGSSCELSDLLRDPLTLGQGAGGHGGPDGLVEDAAHGGVDRALQEGAQAGAVQRQQLLLGAGGAAQQPAGDRDSVQHAAQRAQAVGVADPALRACRLDLRAAILGAGDDTRRVPLPPRLLGQPQAPAAAPDDQQSRHRRSLPAPAKCGRAGR